MAECSGSVVSNSVNTQKQSSAVQITDFADEDKTDKVMEPILLEDFKYNEEPRTLVNLFQYFERNNLTPTKNDILVGLVYILMIESGFSPVEYTKSFYDHHFNYQRVLRFSKELPSNWKRGSVYSISFILPSFELYDCKVVCVVLADDLLVNCMVRNIESGGHYNTMLDPLAYFTSSSTNIKKSHLQNLRCLSRLVKQEVCYQAKQAILKENFVYNVCMEALPPEIVLVIMKYLKIQDLIHFGQTNCFFRDIMQTPKLWIRRLGIDFQMNFQRNYNDVYTSRYTYEQLRDYYKKCFITSRNYYTNSHRRFW